MGERGLSDWEEERLGFDEAYRRHAREIYRYCYRVSGSEAEAQDLAQETWIQVWRSLDKFEGRSPLKRWIYRIAFRKWMARRVTADLPVTELDEGLEPTVDPTQRADTRLVLEQALGKLTEPMRVALILVKSEGLTHEEAAAIVGISAGTMRVRVFRALHELRKLMGEGGVALGVFSLRALDGPLREWRDVSPPAGLRERVFGAVQTVPGGGTAVIRSADGRRQRLRRLLAGFVSGLVILGALLLWLVFTTRTGRAGASGVAAVSARKLLERLSRVRTANAEGKVEIYDREGAHVQQRETVRYWYRSPDSYRMERTGGEGGALVRTELSVTGQKAVLKVGQGKAAVRELDAAPQTVLTELAPFMLFTDRGSVSQALNREDTAVVELATDDGAGDGRLFQITSRIANFRQSWLLTIEPSGLVRRVELTRETLVPSGWHLSQRVLLDRFDWGR